MAQHLTPAQQGQRVGRFVRLIIEKGYHPEQAAGEAGFSLEEGHTLLHTRQVKEALASAAATRLVSEALPAAMNVIMQILGDATVAPSVRGKLAVAIVDRAGLGKISEDPSGNTRKSLQDMSISELASTIERLERAQALQDATIDVTPVTRDVLQT